MITCQKQLLAANEKVHVLKNSIVTEKESNEPEDLKLANCSN